LIIIAHECVQNFQSSQTVTYESSESRLLGIDLYVTNLRVTFNCIECIDIIYCSVEYTSCAFHLFFFLPSVQTLFVAIFMDFSFSELYLCATAYLTDVTIWVHFGRCFNSCFYICFVLCVNCLPNLYATGRH